MSTFSRGTQTDLPFPEFLKSMFDSLAGEGIKPCVLRNYEGFPDSNSGRDVDLLVLPSQLPGAVRALQSIQRTRIVGYSERSFVAHTFVAGVSAEPEARALQVDFDLGVTWKGLPFLGTEAVLEAAIPRAAGPSTFFSPSPVHEAIISLLMSLLVGGNVREKYFAGVQRTFAGRRSEVIQALLPHFGLKTATQLVDMVLGGDRQQILGCVGSLRSSLAVHSFLRRPIESTFAVIRHYTSGFAIRYSSKTLETVSVIGPDDSRQNQLVQSLMPMLQFSAPEIERHNNMPGSQTGLVKQGGSSSPNSKAGALTGSHVSMAQAAAWFAEERLSLLKKRKSLTLRIGEGSFLEVTIDPQKFGYDGPMWFVRLLARLIPSPDLWILLDPAPEGTQSTADEVQPGQTQTRLSAYRAFVKTRKRYVILDAGESADRIAESAYAAIIETLAQLTDRRLKSRF